VAARRKSSNITLEDLRAFSVNRSLWQVPTLSQGLTKFGFVQADPIRAPARAQDLILWQRVKNYRAGDLEKRYAKLEVEEDFFVNYGFLTREVQPFMHPREYGPLRIEKAMPGLTDRVLEFVKGNGATHPKMLEAHFGKLSVANNWGGTSQSTTRALDALHYRGLVRVARRDNGIKVYEAAPHLEPMFMQPLEPEAQARGLLELILSVYAPLPLQSLNQLVSLSGYGGPHLTPHVRPPTKNSRVRLRIACVFSHRSIRWFGTADVLSICTVGFIVSRRTRHPRNARWDITRCRCCGAIKSLVGRTQKS
jgi:uncharacterized protein